ncbi:MAG: HEAT repeat domain-containing protein [Candidatus Nanoarchaeia archaeon]
MSQDVVETHKQIIYNSNTPSAVLMESIFELMNEGSLESKEILFDIARNHNCELIRHETIFAIGEIGPDLDIRNFLKQTLSVDSSIVVQHEALVVLGLLGIEEDRSFLEQFLDDEKIEISQSAKVGIQRIEQEFDFYAEVLKSEESEIKFRNQLKDTQRVCENDRIQIMFQLMKHDTSENARAIYQRFTQDPCPIVRHEAAFCLGEMSSDEAYSYLSKGIFEQEYPIAIHEALFALGTTGREEALDVLNEFVNDENYIISQSAVIGKEKIELVKNPYRGV